VAPFVGAWCEQKKSPRQQTAEDRALIAATRPAE
jgi:hypothetical protein